MNETLSPAVTLTREQKERRRLAADQDLLEGEMTQVEITEEHGVTPSAVSTWKCTLEEEDLEGPKTTNGQGNRGLTRNSTTRIESNS